MAARRRGWPRAQRDESHVDGEPRDLRACSSSRPQPHCDPRGAHLRSEMPAAVFEPPSSRDASREQWWTRDVLEWRIQMLMQGQVPAGVPASETRELMALLDLVSDASELKPVAARQNEAAPPTPPAAQPAAAPAASRCRSASAVSAAPARAASRCRSASAVSYTHLTLPTILLV